MRFNTKTSDFYIPQNMLLILSRSFLIPLGNTDGTNKTESTNIIHLWSWFIYSGFIALVCSSWFMDVLDFRLNTRLKISLINNN